MYNTLNEIKLQLHDAPTEVKEAFNSIVEYFDFGKGKGKFGKSSPQNWIVYMWEMPGGSGKGVSWPAEKTVDMTAVRMDDPKAAEDQVRYRVEREKGGKFIKVLGFFKGEDSFDKAKKLSDEEYKKLKK